MSQHYSTGIAAARLSMPYYLLLNLARKRTDLPGMTRIGKGYAFAADKLGELRAMLIREGHIEAETVGAK